jgi:hypothetical protein
MDRLLAYPQRLMAYTSFIIFAAGVLEALQLMTRDRHGRIADAIVKAVGGTFGVAVALIILIVAERRKTELPLP